jgi:hypothetical protein
MRFGAADRAGVMLWSVVLKVSGFNALLAATVIAVLRGR